MSGAFAGAIANTLLHSLWEGSVVALTLAVVLSVAHSSRVRYAAGCAAMLLLLAGLAVTFSRFAPEASVHVQPSAAGHLGARVRVIQEVAPAVPASAQQPVDFAAWLVPIWIAGVFLFYLRGMTGWIAARRLRQTGVCCVPVLWESRMNRLRTTLRLSRPVSLLESSLAEVPVVVGYLRPVILMPVGLLAGLPTGQIEAILLHELAHIRRYDYVVNMAQVFVEGLLFYHPAVWWISRVMRTERENCCDDVVVSITGGAHEYARALEVLERGRISPGMAMAASGGSLVSRIHRLLGRRENRYATVMPVIAMAVLTVAAVTATAALQTRAVERTIVPPVAHTIVDAAQPIERAEAAPVLIAQATPPPAPAPRAGSKAQDIPVSPPSKPALPDHKIVPDDLLSISIADQPEVSRPAVRVGRDGRIALPLLYDRIRAEGLLPSELETAIADGLVDQKILSHPRVTVSVLEYATPKIWVTGQVGHAQAVPIGKPDDATVLKAIAFVEGLTPNHASTAYIYRIDASGRRQEIAVPLKEILEGKAPDVRLQADDILLIPREMGSDPRQLLQGLPTSPTRQVFYDTPPPPSPWETGK